MDTVVTRLTRSWTDMTAVWAAAAPPAVAGEEITVQAGNAGDAHAIEILQAAAAPAATASGHVVSGVDTVTLTTAAGRKHYARAYFDSATVVATGTGLSAT